MRDAERTFSPDGLPPPEPPATDPGATLEQTAIHEAAHVVVATLIRRGIVEEVFVTDRPVDVGDFFGELNTFHYGLTGGTRFRKIKTTLFQQGLIAYSGFYAQCEHLFRNGIPLAPRLPRLRAQAAHDLDRYLDLLIESDLPPDAIQELIVDVGTTLKRYFDSGIWQAVERIAAALLDRGRLSGDEVLDLLPGLPSWE